MKTLAIFDRKNYDLSFPRVIRNSTRAIIIVDNKIALCYLKKYDIYAFPGGKIEDGETHIQTLVREVKEEAGLIVKQQSIKEFGKITEIRKDLFIDGIFEQHDFYYTCSIENARVKPSLSESEKESGFQFEFVLLDKAILKNEMAIRSGKECDERETYILRLIRDNARV